MTDNITTITTKENEPPDFCSFEGCGGSVAVFGDICGYHRIWTEAFSQGVRMHSFLGESTSEVTIVIEAAKRVADASVAVPLQTHVHVVDPNTH